MSDLEKRSARSEPDDGSDDLPALVARLGEEIVTLLDAKISLLKVEAKEDALAYVHASTSLVASAVVALIGCALVGVTMALLVARLLESAPLSQAIRYAIATFVTGVVLIVVGFAAGKRTVRGLGRTGALLPNSVRSLKKDEQWLRS